MTELLPQGDPRLLHTPLAQRLLASTELARFAYIASDGTPRVLPMLFHWTGDELVFSTFAGSHKVEGLQRAPEIAVAIDRAGPPPEVLLLRGRVSLTEIEGIAPEYAQAQARYFGPEQGARAVAEADRPGTRMVRIALRPNWVGTIDFVERFPGGATVEQFARRGQA